MNNSGNSTPTISEISDTGLYRSEGQGSKQRKAYRSSLLILIIIACSIFVIETLIMLYFSFFPPPFSSRLVVVFLDSMTLMVLLSPILYFLLFRPLLRHIAERKRGEEEIRLLQTMTQVISESRDFHSALEVAMQKVCETTGWVVGEAWVPSPDGKCLEFSAAWHSNSIKDWGKFVAESRRFTFLSGIGLPGRVWSSRKPMWIGNVTTDPNFPRAAIAREYGLKGAMSIPICLDNGEVFAVIDFLASRLLSEKDERLLGLVSAVTIQLGTLIQRKLADEALQNALHELEQRSFEIRTLSEMSDNLQVCNTAEEAYTAVAQSIRLLFPTGALFVCSTSRNLLKAVTVWGKVSMEEPISMDDCYALRLGHPHTVMDVQTGLRCHHLGENADPYLCVPFMGQGETLGVLYLSAGPPSAWGGKNQSEAKRRLAIDASERIGLALANLKLRDTLRNLSIRDALTGLFNRRYLEESLEREIYRAERKGAPLGVVMLDIDHFKQFNDTFGHEAGDAILHEIGALLQRHVRSSDIACRYGGEEFTLIMPETSLEIACQRAGHLREAVKHLQVQHGKRSLGDVTLSFGVAVFPDHGTTAETLLRAADTALYQAKSEGRDRVCAAGL